MKFEIIEHSSKETGELIGYELKYKAPWSTWESMVRIYKGSDALGQVEHDICLLLRQYGKLKPGKQYQ